MAILRAMARRSGAAALAGLLLCLSPAQATAQELELSKEQKLKAAFVFNFTKFIEWPGTGAGPDASLVIGTFCDAPLNAELDRVAGDRKVNGRSIRVLRLDSTDAAAAAHLVYVCAEQTERFGRLRDTLGGRPVVTVGESESASRLGATIVFIVVDDRIRFDVDARAAGRTGVKISAQLLKLARTVRSE